jgi:plastocyanin
MTPRRAALSILLLLATAAPSGLAAQTINECTFGDPSVVNWLDVSPAQREVTFVCCAYTPPCSLIDAGQTVTFSGSFSSHPLRGGEVVAGVPQPQAGNPIPDVNSGTIFDVTFPDPGAWGFYCDAHFGFMYGAVFVAIFADGFESGDFVEWTSVVPLGFPLDD